MAIDIVKSATVGLVHRAKDGTLIQVAVYDNGTVRILMERPDNTVLDKIVRNTDAEV